ncbi:MAG: HNH endonuclease [Pseudomonadota bacterium]
MLDIDRFVELTPSMENYWRSIILFGRNVASYKFALAQALLDLRQQPGDCINLEDLAGPFSRHLCTHLQHSPKQVTSRSSRFLDACAQFNAGALSEQQLTETTVRLGFNNVIDAFHVVNQKALPVRFFADERRAGVIRLTDAFYTMQSALPARDLPAEVESRWRLVETAWALNLSRNLVAVGYEPTTQELVTRLDTRRTTITSCRGALNGYQQGRCFYCSAPISIAPGESNLADVDHFFPYVLSTLHDAFRPIINGVWNLVLACTGCNRGPEGKSARIPDLRLLERLHRRNEYLISSHHPLRETIVAQTGASEPTRRAFLQTNYNHGRSAIIHTWFPKNAAADCL